MLTAGTVSCDDKVSLHWCPSRHQLADGLTTPGLTKMMQILLTDSRCKLPTFPRRSCSDGKPRESSLESLLRLETSFAVTVAYGEFVRRLVFCWPKSLLSHKKSLTSVDAAVVEHRSGINVAVVSKVCSSKAAGTERTYSGRSNFLLFIYPQQPIVWSPTRLACQWQFLI